MNGVFPRPPGLNGAAIPSDFLVWILDRLP
jgi:hypothetical protein